MSKNQADQVASRFDGWTCKFTLLENLLSSKLEVPDVMKPVLYFDMDGVLVDFGSGIDACSDAERKEFAGRLDEVPGIFGKMKPMTSDCVEIVKRLASRYDIFFLSTASWGNPSAWSDKRIWIERYFGEFGKKRLILSHQKHLNWGHILVDDRPTHNGADRFIGKLVHFGPNGVVKTWAALEVYLTNLKFTLE